MAVNIRLDARRRMGKLLSSSEIQRRISCLDVRMAKFSADIMEAVSMTTDNARLNESEVFALFELAAKMDIRMDGSDGGARLDAIDGHAAVTMDFANLFRLYQRLVRPDSDRKETSV